MTFLYGDILLSSMYCNGKRNQQIEVTKTEATYRTQRKTSSSNPNIHKVKVIKVSLRENSLKFVGRFLLLEERKPTVDCIPVENLVLVSSGYYFF